MVEVLLYNSVVCRLCGDENENGTLLYSTEDNERTLAEIINTYLPLKVSDDGELPRTVCPGCAIQVEAMVEFINLIIKGQNTIRELHGRELQLKKEEPNIITENIVYEIDSGEGVVYHVEHPVSLQMAGLERPRRKRGRPPKRPKSEEELAREAADAAERQARAAAARAQPVAPGKRRRKTPTRFREAVQGKELERIFKEEGVIEAEDSEPEGAAEGAAGAGAAPQPEVIGRLEASGELVVMMKGKGRGRPKGRTRSSKEECAICGLKYTCRGRYMSHVAQHGPVRYQCAQCDAVFDTRLEFNQHQEQLAHSGQNVLPINKVEAAAAEPPSQPPAAGAADTEGAGDAGMEVTDPPTEVTDPPAEVNDPPAVVNDPPAEEPEPPAADETATAPEAEAEAPAAAGERRRLPCPQCDKTFGTKQSKSMHIKAVHAGLRPYVCAECGAAFPYPRSLAVHRVSHRRAASARGYACDLCGKVLSHPSSVVYHRESVHAGRRYVCLKCGKAFRHRQLLRRHQLVHSAARPMECQVCHATFKTKTNLLKHQLLHSGVKRFACAVCQQRFAHKASLTLHMRLHTGVKPFTCPVCDKSFTQKGNLSEHVRIHTGERPFACASCPARFTTSSQRRAHHARHAHCPSRFLCRDSCRSHVRRALSPRRERRPPPRRRAPPAGAPAAAPGDRRRPPKQVSLLAPDSLAEETMVVHDDIQADGAGAEAAGGEESIIYVTYDVAHEGDYQILEAEEVPSPADEGGAMDLFMQPEPGYSEVYYPEQPPVAVMDDEGNPLQFTMQDGTRLAITSADGHTLQVITQDGQSIPVEINNYEEELEETAVQELSVQKAVATGGGHYFTVV